MMDEKKIEEAQENIFEDKFLGNGEDIIFTNDEGGEDYREEMYYDGQIKEAISLGAHWAIQEFLKDLWHDASEEPKKWEKTIFHQNKDGSFNNFNVKKEVKLYIDMDCSTLWRHHKGFYKPIRWLYIDDILPKQKGGSE